MVEETNEARSLYPYIGLSCKRKVHSHINHVLECLIERGGVLLYMTACHV